MQTSWSIRTKRQKGALSFKTGALEKQVQYTVDDSSFYMSKCYLCRLRGHEAHVFSVHSSIDFL